jgi:hypothetical protein
MSLRVLPRVPTAADVLRISLGRLSRGPAEWQPYLPPDLSDRATGADDSDDEPLTLDTAGWR